MDNMDTPFGNAWFGQVFSDMDDEGMTAYELELEGKLLALDPHLPGKVLAAAQGARNGIQSRLRTETALRLNDSGDHHSVRVRIFEGLPVVLKKMLEGPEPPQVPWFFLDKRALQGAAGGLEYLAKHRSEIDGLLSSKSYSPTLSERDPDGLLTILQFVLKELDDPKRPKDIVDTIIGFDTDIMGAYFFRRGEIRLYWLAIGLVALKYGLPVESLAKVVAAHEWAHVYTHLGMDTGRHSWNTEAFAAAPAALLESLAQFYAGIFCEMDSSGDRTFEAYLMLLGKQAKPYRSHLEWLPALPGAAKSMLGMDAEDAIDCDRWKRITQPHLREAVRYALIEARNPAKPFACYSSFVDSLRKIHSRLASGPV